MIDSWFQYVDIFETKGVEYIIVLFFFGCFVYFVRSSIFRPLWHKLKITWTGEK